MRHRRRWFMPALILLIALVLFAWSRQRAAQAMADVEQFMAHVVRSGPPVGAATPPGLTDQLASLGSDPGAEVFIDTGDVESGDGSATHTALIVTDGTPRLGLRLVHHPEGPPPAVSILGYWIP